MSYGWVVAEHRVFISVLSNSISTPFPLYYTAFFWKGNRTKSWTNSEAGTLLNPGEEDNHLCYAIWRTLKRSYWSLVFPTIPTTVPEVLANIALRRALGSCLSVILDELAWSRGGRVEVLCAPLCHLCFDASQTSHPFHFSILAVNLRSLCFSFFGWIVLCSLGEGMLMAWRVARLFPFATSSHSC